MKSEIKIAIIDTKTMMMQRSLHIPTTDDILAGTATDKLISKYTEMLKKAPEYTVIIEGETENIILGAQIDTKLANDTLKYRQGTHKWLENKGRWEL